MLLQLPVALQAPRLYAPLLSRLSHHTLQCWRMHLPQPAVRQQLLSVTDRLQQQRQQTSLLIVVVMLLLGGTPCFMLQWIVLILQLFLWHRTPLPGGDRSMRNIHRLVSFFSLK